MKRSRKIPDSLNDMAHKVKSKAINENSFLDLSATTPSVKKEHITMVKAFTAKS